MPTPKVSIIIPTMKGREAMLQRLLATIPDDYEKIIVNDENLLLAAKRNKGARVAKGRFLLFIDDDNYLKEFIMDWMLLYWKEHTGVMGMVACYADKKLIIADGGSNRNYLTGWMTGVATNRNILNVQKECVDQCYQVNEVANAFMIRKDVFDDVGGFDEVNFPIDMDEADICKRISNSGYKILMNPHAICYHNSQTYSRIPDFRRPMNAYFMARNKVLFQKKHLNKFQLFIYFIFCFPIFILGYTVCLLYRGKPNMVLEYWKGSLDGILGRIKNKYQ